MFLCGRNEKRLLVAITAYLLDTEGSRGTEQVLTENVSPGGARVLSKHRWQSDERLRIVGFANEFTGDARVVYCQHRAGEGFYVGLELRKPVAAWWEAEFARRIAGKQAQNGV